MPQESSVPAGWEVVTESSASSVPAGWEVVGAPETSGMNAGTPGLALAGANSVARPAIAKAAGMVANSHAAQKVLAQGAQSAVGAMTAGPIGVLARVPGVRVDKGVGAIASRTASRLGGSSTLLGRMTGPLSMLLGQTGDRAPGTNPAANQQHADDQYREILIRQMLDRQSRPSRQRM